jgi:hypothetical protein
MCRLTSRLRRADQAATPKSPYRILTRSFDVGLTQFGEAFARFNPTSMSEAAADRSLIYLLQAEHNLRPQVAQNDNQLAACFLGILMQSLQIKQKRVGRINEGR